MAAQALVGIAFWVMLVTSPTARSWFELMPEHHALLSSMVFGDLLVIVLGSALSAWGIASGARWAVPVVAFTAGGVIYPTLYLVGWVSFTGVGALCLAIMGPPSTLTCWIAYQTWRADR
jgi:hypothetical protein